MTTPLTMSTGYGDGTTSATILPRILQSTTSDNGVFSAVFLASIIGLGGLIALVGLTYIVSLLCDSTVRLFSPFRNPVPVQQGLNRDRIDTAIQKKIVKELFANETFLYTRAAAATSKKQLTGDGVEPTATDGKDKQEDSGVELQDMSLKTNATAETDEEAPAAAPPAQKEASPALNNNDAVTDDKDSEMFTSNEPACCICLAPYREGDSILRSKHCTHMFHSACCEDWILLKPVCPLCANPMVLDAEWEATAASVLGQERYNAMLSEQREGRTEGQREERTEGQREGTTEQDVSNYSSHV